MTNDPPAARGRVADRGHRRLGIDDAASLDRDAFVAAFGGVFEDSPWIADAAYDTRPWASVDALHVAMTRVVDTAPPDARLSLIRAHPDLAGKAAIAGELTPESAREQVAAGLDRLTPQQHADVLALTAAYRERFGFPFIVCAREHTADTIIAAARERLDHHEPDDEERTALTEIYKIAALRLADLVEEGPSLA
ncbi:2-oxo-4-hydroxy-4-carboxy-5-ureidoimidazoline decarboxylase [Baekduia sp. Peel2402]|uniref:2-oxo-4-hydroxy-4-carboxy-5-ureidoimidazoline decarboxylase n=1 Tax=Baekduia sp. Peel2402 TaxID=3458296 RepID=UPI00403EF410